jgi:uncharacterized protein YaiI (UPF0178 family)
MDISQGPRIWVDADALPRSARELLLRVAERSGITMTFVANTVQRVPRSLPNVTAHAVVHAIDAADEHIVASLARGDLVVTADVPLAAAAVARGAIALDPRGVLIDEANVGERAAMRDLLGELHDGGATIGGPASYSATDRQRFANALDRWLTRARRSSTT